MNTSVSFIKRHPLLSLASLVLLAAMLRTPLTPIGPLIPLIQETTGLSGTLAGLITGLPLILFGLISGFVPRYIQRLGIERLVVLAAFVLFFGSVLRASTNSIALLFIGTFILGMAIAIGNVVAPVTIKRDYPEQIARTTAFYAMTMTLSSGLSSGLAVPMANLWGGHWQPSLMLLSLIIAIPACAIWLWRLRDTRLHPMPPVATPPKVNVWRYWLAWQVTIFTGFQAFSFYALVAWLPAMLKDWGLPLTLAGWALTFLQIMALLANLVLSRMQHNDQRRMALGVSILCAGGFIGLMVAPGWLLLWISSLGLGLGGCLYLSLSLVSTRADSVAQTASLAGMSQSMGYLIGAAGPLVAGFLHDATASWQVVLLLLVGISVAQGWFGWGAGRPVTLTTSVTR
ncbi:MAG: MFS transporter [Pigmentiphaga sp.]|nr:MFS transporter [Pigmentiphaga sp.]